MCSNLKEQRLLERVKTDLVMCKHFITLLGSIDHSYSLGLLTLKFSMINRVHMINHKVFNLFPSSWLSVAKQSHISCTSSCQKKTTDPFRGKCAACSLCECEKAELCKAKLNESNSKDGVHHAAQPPALIRSSRQPHSLCMVPAWTDGCSFLPHSIDTKVNRQMCTVWIGAVAEGERSHIVYPVDSACRAFRGAELVSGKKPQTGKPGRRSNWMAFLQGFVCR